VPDQRTLALRRQVTRRNQIVRQRTRLKTIIQSILHAHLVPPCPHADLLGPKGRAWLLGQELPPDEQDAVARHLREHDRFSENLRPADRHRVRLPAGPDRQLCRRWWNGRSLAMRSPTLIHSTRPTRKGCSTSSVVHGW
jgi:transposase